MMKTMPKEATPGLNEPAAWAGRIWRCDAGAVFHGMGGLTSLHRHPVFKLVLGRGVRRLGAARCEPRGIRLLVRPNEAHVVDGPGLVTVVYLDPRVVHPRDAQRAFRGARGAIDFDTACDWLASVPRRRVPLQLAASLEDWVSGRRLQPARWSSSRFAHLVTDVYGAPPRAWRSWTRLLEAIDAVGAGRSVTTAAHEAGFSDTAHFSRRCRAMLGIVPTVITRSAWRSSIAR
jgi:AraC-like DNA-binding protein